MRRVPSSGSLWAGTQARGALVAGSWCSVPPPSHVAHGAGCCWSPQGAVMSIQEGESSPITCFSALSIPSFALVFPFPESPPALQLQGAQQSVTRLRNWDPWARTSRTLVATRVKAVGSECTSLHPSPASKSGFSPVVFCGDLPLRVSTPGWGIFLCELFMTHDSLSDWRSWTNSSLSD